MFRMREHFNPYDHLAGCFVPHWLLSLKGLSPGAKLCYSVLAQQCSKGGTAQLNLPLLAASAGEAVAEVVLRLQELERVGLVTTSRGNSNTEDVRVHFPPPFWAGGTERSADSRSHPQPGLFPVEVEQPQGGEEIAPGAGKRRRRWFGRARSRHSLETCLAFVTYQREELGRRRIYDPEGLAESLYHTGSQDDEIDDWLAEQSAGAA